jgi:translation initiation factor 2A
VPGAEPVGDDAAKKNKKKRGKKNNQDGRPEADPNGGASLAPYDNRASGTGRSPERRGPANSNGRDHRSRSRTNGNRSRSNTHQSQRFNSGQQNNFANAQQQGGASVAAPAPDAGQSADAKKIRSLQKKIRAIEDLEMRLAGGEKLEDTQVKKINTKSAVMRELEGLEKEA